MPIKDMFVTHLDFSYWVFKAVVLHNLFFVLLMLFQLLHSEAQVLIPELKVSLKKLAKF